LEDFIFNAAAVGDTNTFDFEPTLFHFPSQLRIQRAQGWMWYYALHPKNKRVVFSLYLNINEGVARSSVQSPFGTIECSNDLPLETLYNFLAFVETRLRSLGVRELIIKNPPFHYNEEKGALLQVYLFNLGYTVTCAEVGAIRFTTEHFAIELTRMERRKLKKSENAGLTYRLLSNENVQEVYSFIFRCRQQKGYSLSMTFEDLLHAMQEFPDRYLLFGVFHGEQIIAASVTVRITSGILYIFYADHAHAYDKLSPVVMLVKGIYMYCQQHGITLLDFGTSARNGQPNFGLLNFKHRLGAKLSPRLTFAKTLT
jgi:hypothetical protein